MEPKGPAASISEFVGTFFLVLAICGVVSAGAGRAPLTDVALVHTLVLMSLVYALGVGVLIFGPATGASFNPARWFGTVMELDERPLPPRSPVRGESAEPPLASAS